MSIENEMYTVPGRVLIELRELRKLFDGLHPDRIVSDSSDKTRAMIVYKVVVSVAEYEEIDRLRNMNDPKR